MATGKDHRIPRLQFLPPMIETHDIEIAGIIFAREPRTPEEVDHGPGKILVGFAHEFRAALVRQLVAEREFQIAQRHATARAIECRGERADPECKAITSAAREKRNDFRGRFHGQPLEPVTDFFPSRAHRASVSTLRGCREPVAALYERRRHYDSAVIDRHYRRIVRTRFR